MRCSAFPPAVVFWWAALTRPGLAPIIHLADVVSPKHLVASIPRTRSTWSTSQRQRVTKELQPGPISTSRTPADAVRFEIPLPLSSTIQSMSPASMLSCCTVLLPMELERPLPNFGVLP